MILTMKYSRYKSAYQIAKQFLELIIDGPKQLTLIFLKDE